MCFEKWDTIINLTWEREKALAQLEAEERMAPYSPSLEVNRTDSGDQGLVLPLFFFASRLAWRGWGRAAFHTVTE